MKKPTDVLSPLETRGDFKSLARQSEAETLERSSANVSYKDGEIPSDSPVWDVWEAVRGFWPGVTVNWDSTPPIAWVAELAGLTPDQLAHGCRNLCNHVNDNGDNSHPPSAGQFKNLCLNNLDWEHAASRRTAQEAMNAPLIDKGVKVDVLDSPEGMKAREVGDPTTNPNFFEDLWSKA